LTKFDPGYLNINVYSKKNIAHSSSNNSLFQFKEKNSLKSNYN